MTYISLSLVKIHFCNQTLIKLNNIEHPDAKKNLNFTIVSLYLSDNIL